LAAVKASGVTVPAVLVRLAVQKQSAINFFTARKGKITLAGGQREVLQIMLWISVSVTSRKSNG
jgi:hypothetical protein